ncbi:MAG: hypothetical protein R3335_00715 [Anaerolineales bacterium]|nr:hypothetical protein [Anaerolineales bacterium]
MKIKAGSGADKSFRPAGWILIGAAAVMLLGAAIGFLAPSLRDAPWTDDPQLAAVTIAGNPAAYAWANGLILAASIITAIGFVPACAQFRGASRPWAWSAVIAFALAAGFESLDRTISIQVYTWAATQDLQITDPAIRTFILFQEGLSNLFYWLGFLAIGLFGVALLSGPHGSGLGWVFVAGCVLGIGLHLAGGAIPAMIFFGTAAIGGVIVLSDRLE